MKMKKITARQAEKIMDRMGVTNDGDGRTFYATDENETEVWCFDTKMERDEFVNR